MTTLYQMIKVIRSAEAFSAHSEEERSREDLKDETNSQCLCASCQVSFKLEIQQSATPQSIRVREDEPILSSLPNLN